MSANEPVTIDRHPGRSAQAYGIARELGTDIELTHNPSVGVVGNKGDSQCYIGVQRKVEAIHDAAEDRIGTEGDGQIPARLVQPEYTVATSDGIRNGTREMRYSLIGREVTQDSLLRAPERHRPRRYHRGRGLRQAPGRHARGAARAQPARPSSCRTARSIPDRMTRQSNEMLDIVTAYQVSRAPGPGIPLQDRLPSPARAIGSCGGMFTYNTMQTFIGVVGMQPLHMVAPPSDDPRRMEEFPAQLVGLPRQDDGERHPPARHRRDVTAMRNALIVAMAVGGSTNVVLHAPEIGARRRLSPTSGRTWSRRRSSTTWSQHVVPVLTNARPYGQLFDGRHRPRSAACRSSSSELMDAGHGQRRCADLHRRDPGRAGRAAGREHRRPRWRR